MLRIALLIPTYRPGPGGSAGTTVCDVGSALARRGHRVTVLTAHLGLPSSGAEEGVTVRRAWRPPPLPPLRHYEDHVETIPATAVRLRRGFDVAHAFSVADAFAAALARRLGGPPFVFSIDRIATRRHLVDRRYRLEMIERAIREAAVVAVPSEAAAEPLRRYGLVDPLIVPPNDSAGQSAVDEAAERWETTYIEALGRVTGAAG